VVVYGITLKDSVRRTSVKNIEEVEDQVMLFLTERTGARFSPLDLVRGVCERFPEDKLHPVSVKIAALNLVNAGRILIDQAWTVGCRTEKDEG
jgi:hypothetical protein